jgi:hypothetical protein
VSSVRPGKKEQTFAPFAPLRDSFLRPFLIKISGTESAMKEDTRAKPPRPAKKEQTFAPFAPLRDLSSAFRFSVFSPGSCPFVVQTSSLK